MSKLVVIIGGGPAGIEAAKAAASAGAKVTLVSDSPLGGRAGWHSLLPSKVWLTAADTLGLALESDALGLAVEGEQGAVPAAIIARIKRVKESWSHQAESALKELGVKVITGIGSFESEKQVVVKNADGEIVADLQPDATILASGSLPFFPKNLRPDGSRVIAPRFAGSLQSLPSDVVVIGAGATGTEFVYLFNRLGVNVTWIVDQFGVLPTFSAPAGEFMANVIKKRGVTIVEGQLAEHINRDETGVTVVTSDQVQHRAALAFVAIGRFADLGRFNLEAAGLSVDAGRAPEIDEFCRTGVAGIYAVGDAAGAPMVANRAMAQAWVAGKHAAGATVSPFRAETVIHAIYSEPQVAEVGVMAGEGIKTVEVPFTETMKAHLIPEGAGFVKLAFNRERRITGGLAVGPHAADVLAPVAVAIQLNGSVDDLALLFAAHPTLSELAFMAARSG